MSEVFTARAFRNLIISVYLLTWFWTELQIDFVAPFVLHMKNSKTLDKEAWFTEARVGSVKRNVLISTFVSSVLANSGSLRRYVTLHMC